jgi:hypothetical protein
MAITILSKPTDALYYGYVPCYNNQWFVASSSQTASANFKYYIVVTDILSGYSITEKFLPNPSGKLQFDASKFSELLMTNYIPVNVYGFQQNTSIRKIRVNIGEIYGSTLPGTIYSGTDIDYIVWNGSLEMLTFSQYNSKNYTWDLSTTPNLNYPVLLSDLADDYTYNNRSNFLYWMVLEGQTDLPKIYLRTYNAAGSVLNTYTITNSYNALTSPSVGYYRNNMVCIDVGKKGIDGINASYLVGVEYYDIMAEVSSETAPFKIKRYTIKCSPRFDVFTLHYLSTTGAYETLHCSKVSELNSTKTSTTFKRSPWTNVSNVMTLDYSVAVEQPTIVNVQNGLKLNSDWVTKAELLKYKDLFSSPDVKLDLGIAQGYASVKVTNGTYVSKNNDKLRNLTFDLLFTHNNQRQKG